MNPVYFIILAFPILSSAGTLAVTTDYVCDDHSAIGNTVCCNNTACSLGISDAYGENFGHICLDLDTNDLCDWETQIMLLDTTTYVPVGTCTYPAGDTEVKLDYSWSCCSCPSPWVFYYSLPGYCTFSAPDTYCMACVDDNGVPIPGEAVYYDPTTQVLACESAPSVTPIPPAPCNEPIASFLYGATNTDSCSDLCDSLDDLMADVTALSNLNQWLAALCPATSWVSIGASLAIDVYDIIEADTNPTSGISGTEYTAWAAVLSSLSTFLLAAGFSAAGITLAGITAAMGSLWAIFCTVDLVETITLAAEKAALVAFKELACPGSPFKRSIAPMALPMGPTHSLHQRGDTYNPCTELLSYFPTNYTTATAADAACNQLGAYNATSANITGFQQLCNAYQSSGNNVTTIAFQNLLSAVEAVIPYCNTTVDVQSLSSSSSHTSTSSTTRKSTSTSSLISSSQRQKTSTRPSSSSSSAHTTSATHSSSKATSSRPKSSTSTISSKRSTSTKSSSHSTSSRGTSSKGTSSKSTSSNKSTSSKKGISSTKSTSSKKNTSSTKSTSHHVTSSKSTSIRSTFSRITSTHSTSTRTSTKYTQTMTP